MRYKIQWRPIHELREHGGHSKWRDLKQAVLLMGTPCPAPLTWDGWRAADHVCGSLQKSEPGFEFRVVEA